MRTSVLVLAPSERELEGVLPNNRQSVDIAGTHVIGRSIGVGKVLSALDAQSAILHHKPSLVVLVGYCGALDPHLQILDAVIAEKVIQYDLDLRAFGLPRGGTFDAKSQVCEGSCSLYAPALKDFKRGVLGSGDRFLVRSYRNTHPFLTEELGLMVSDMEGFSVAQAAKASNVDCAILRVVSDDEQGRRPKRFSSFVREASKKLSYGLLQLLEEPREKSPTNL